MKVENILVGHYYIIAGMGIMKCSANRVGQPRTDEYAKKNAYLKLKVETIEFETLIDQCTYWASNDAVVREATKEDVAYYREQLSKVTNER